MEQQQEQERRHHQLLRLVMTGAYWLARKADWQPIETIVSLFALGWAFVLLWPSHLFGISPTYAPMRNIAASLPLHPETTWGLLALIAPTVHIVGVLCCHVDRAWCSDHAEMIRAAGLLGFVAWNVFLSIMFISSGILSYAAISHPLLFLTATWTLWRFAGRQRE